MGSNIDPIGTLAEMGFKPTSGYRTKAHQAELKRKGLTPTAGGSHPKGDALDFMPPKGMSLVAAVQAIKKQYPDARVAPSNNGAIHVTFPGWGRAPDVSGSRRRYGE